MSQECYLLPILLHLFCQVVSTSIPHFSHQVGASLGIHPQVLP